jgi:tryptophan synthase alpha chain
MFGRLEAEERIAFIPFVQVGDPGPDESFKVIMALVEAGADALELGIPFSDPVADGPTIQASAQRALLAGTTPTGALDIIARVRAAHPTLPIGLLVYANLVAHDGLDRFYGSVAQAGVDSVLVADVPSVEGGTYAASARRYGVDPVFIVAPNTPDRVVERVASLGSGYTYVVARAGVTGADEAGDYSQTSLLQRLHAAGAPPAVFGFGIADPAHVQEVARAGGSGAISGSAVVSRLANEGLDSAVEFVRTMSRATHIS